MSSRANLRTSLSYASRKPGLREAMPESLRKAGSTKTPFDHASDPWRSKQLTAERHSEAQRRGDGDGSTMIKLHKPFPELRPKHDHTQVRQSFNRAWLREAREAQMKQFEAQAQQMQSEGQQELKHQQQHEYGGPRHQRG